MPVDQERIHSLFGKLSRELGKVATKTQAKNVHLFRTSTRRLEAVVEELVPVPDANLRKLMKQLGKLRRRAGRVRDLDVLSGKLRSLKLAEDPSRKLDVLRSLAARRKRQEEKLVKALDRNTVREIRKRLKRAEAELVVPRNLEPAAVAMRLFAMLARDHEDLTPELLHQYRLKGKRIRYIAELGGEEPQASKIVEELKRMQDAIGEWNDWLTLSETAEKLADHGRPSALLSALNNITHAKFRDAIEVIAHAKAALLPNSALAAKPPEALARRKSVSADRQMVAATA
jgi:CHAD domain-containing protein